MAWPDEPKIYIPKRTCPCPFRKAVTKDEFMKQVCVRFTIPDASFGPFAKSLLPEKKTP